MQKKIRTKNKFTFLTFKIKKSYLGIAAAAVILICAALVLQSGIKKANAVETFSMPLSNKVIIIDPGHGGIDAGAVANDTVEKEINLKIAFMLQKYIEEGGGVAILTRTDDSDTADPDRAKGMTQKMSDLKERKKDIEENNANMFISIHMNKFQQPQYKGAQVFYTSKSEESKILGETLQQSIKDVIGDDNTRLAKPGGNGIYVLKDNTVPSALVECGFLSNPQEAQQLKDESYQRRMAWGIYLGIARFFSR